MERRLLFPWLAGLPLLAFGRTNAQEPQKTQKLKIMMKSAWGSDDPTRASFPFVHGLALAEAGHEVQIFLIGEATYLMRKETANAIMPVRMAAAERDYGKGRGQTHSHLFLRSLLPCPWGHGNRLELMRSEVRQSVDFCVAH